MPKNKLFKLLSASILFIPYLALAEFKYNLPEPASILTAEIYGLHMFTSLVATIIMLIVTAIITYSLYTHRKSRGYTADVHFHESWFGKWSWILVPVIVLGIDFSIAKDATKTLNKIETYPKADLTVKVTGSQWKWTYEYMDHGIKFNSNLKKLPSTDKYYLREVDKPLVLPINQNIRFLHTATDVLHNWWVPSIAYKKDSIPGYINETMAFITKTGTFRGQCAENCGTGHAYMPIVVNAVSEADFEVWKTKEQAKMAQAKAEASADKIWTKDELYARGEAIYTKNCVACHQLNGQGLPGVFPALKGSVLATKDKAGHINMVLNGKAGTAMAAWGKQLDDLQLASVITYERNAWDNNTGDAVQPKEIKQLRK